MSLYQLARDGAADELRSRMCESGSAAVRRRAAELLGDLGNDDPEVVDALIRAVREDDDEGVRGAAVDALDALGDRPMERLIGELAGVDVEGADWAAASAFVRALDAALPELRMAAANALGRLDERRAVSPLTVRLDDADPRVRTRAATSLGRLGYPEAVESLVAALDDDHDAVRQAAADALASIGSDPALAALLDLFEDGDEAIRRTAVAALGNAESSAPVSPLVAALDDESRLVRRAAVFSIVELLSNVPAERSHQVRESVVDHLRTGDDDTVVDPLVDILEESVEVAPRRNATWLVGRVASEESERAVSALTNCLADGDERTARFAATSLAEMGGESVEAELVDYLDTNAPAGARAHAAFVLGRVGSVDARKRLQTLVGDDADADEEVRRRAFSALSKLGGVGDAMPGDAPGGGRP